MGFSTQLERLSLVQVGHQPPVVNRVLFPPNRVLRFPNLTFLKLDDHPVSVKHTLTYMDLPVIASLKIRSLVPLDLARTPNRLFPDDRLPARLINPPTFAVRTAGGERIDRSIKIEIGNVKIRFDFSLEDGGDEVGRDFVMSGISELVPPSVTALNLDYTKLDEYEWRHFFTSHPEVRSIKCTDLEFCGRPVDPSLWDVLSPTRTRSTRIPCPKLESVSIESRGGEILSTPLVNCLRYRQAAGFKLKHLKIVDRPKRMRAIGYADEFGPLVEVVEVDEPSEDAQRVSSVSMDDDQPPVG